LQQYPSTHDPLEHSAPCAQAWPFTFKHAPAPLHAWPLPHGTPCALAVMTHPPAASQPLQVWQLVGVQAAAQQLPAEPLPVSAPQVEPEVHSRHDATAQVDGVDPFVVLQAMPVAIRGRQVPTPLQ
jgi:hypothetical protein